MYLFETVKEEIKRMAKLGVIQRVEKSTDWCHPIVVVAKPNNQIRLCIDPTKLNVNSISWNLLTKQ